MFYSDYNPELAIKKWAKVLVILTYVLAGVCVLGAFIILCINPERLWWISLSVLVGACLFLVPAVISSHVLWGFAEIIENTKKIAKGTCATDTKTEDVLPDL